MEDQAIFTEGGRAVDPSCFLNCLIRISSMITLSVKKFVRCAIYHQKMDVVGQKEKVISYRKICFLRDILTVTIKIM